MREALGYLFFALGGVLAACGYGGRGDWVFCLVVAVYLLQSIVVAADLPWRRYEVEWMLAEAHYFVMEAGIWAHSEIDERTISWSDVNAVATSESGVLIAERRLRPLVWIPARALVQVGSREALLAIVAKQRKWIARLGD
jgi:hypothetical protein